MDNKVTRGIISLVSFFLSCGLVSACLNVSTTSHHIREGEIMDSVKKDTAKFVNDYVENDICISTICIDSSGDNQIAKIDSNGIYTQLECMPTFPGGTSVLLEFIYSSMNYPSEALKDSIQGKAVVRCIIEKDGSISNPIMVKSSGYERNPNDSIAFKSFDNEALRIISIMPKWNPGKHEEEPCRCWVTIPINFRLN